MVSDYKDGSLDVVNMKILEVVPDWPTTTFLTRHIADLSQHISVEVGVAGYGDTDMSNVFSTKQDVKLVPLYLGSKVRRITKTLSGLISYPDKPHLSIREKAVLKLLEKSSPDIVHFHINFLFDLCYLPLELGIPFTVSLRGPEVQMVAFTDLEYRKKLCGILQQAAAIHTVCDALGKRVIEYCQTDLPVITVRTAVPMPEDPEKTASDTRSLITVGRLYWKKGIHDLIRAMSYQPDISLKIVGEGEEWLHLKYLIESLNLQDRVQLLGKLPYEEFEALMRNSTAYVQASMEEGFSNSVAEAMALGKPAFVTDVGGTGELIKDGENGIYIPMGDPIGIAKQFDKLFDIQLMQRLGEAARKTAEYEFSGEKHTKEFVEFYEYALTQHNNKQ